MFVDSLRRVSVFVACAQSAVLFDGYSGQHSGCSSERIRQEVKVVMESELEAARAALSATIDKSLRDMSSTITETLKSQTQLINSQKKLEEDAARALKEVAMAGEAVRKDGALLRQEMAEEASALDARVTQKFVDAADREQLARDQLLAAVHESIDAAVERAEKRTMDNARRIETELREHVSTAIDNVNSLLDRFSLSSDARLKDIDSRLNATANASEVKRLELEAVTLARFQSQETNLSHLRTALSLFEDDANEFAEVARNWSSETDAWLNSLQANLSRVSMMTSELSTYLNETDERLENVRFETQDYAARAANWLQAHETNLTAIAANLTSLELATLARFEAVEHCVNKSENRIDQITQMAGKFAVSALNWTNHIDSSLDVMAHNLSKTDSRSQSKITAIEIEMNETEAWLRDEINRSAWWAVDHASALLATATASWGIELEATQKKLSSALAVAINDTTATFDKVHDDALSSVANLTTYMRDVYEESASTFRDQIGVVEEQLENSASSTLVRFQEIKTDLSHLNDTVDEINAALRRTHQETSVALAEMADVWARNMEAKFYVLSNATLSLEIALNATVSAVDAEVSARRRDSAQVQRRVDEVDVRLANAIIELDGKVWEADAELEVALNWTKDKLSESNVTQNQRIDNVFSALQSGDAMLERLIQVLKSVDLVEIASQINATKLAAESRASEIEARLETVAFRLSNQGEEIRNATSNVTRRFGAFGHNMTALSSTMDLVRADLDAHVNWTSVQADVMAETVATWISDSDHRLRQSIGNLSASMNQTYDHFFSVLGGVQRKLSNHSENISAILAKQRDVSANSITLARQLDDESATLVAMIQDTGAALSNRSSSLERHSTDLEATVTSLTAAVTAIEQSLDIYMNLSASAAADTATEARQRVSELEVQLKDSIVTRHEEIKQAREDAVMHVDEKFATANIVLNATMMAFESSIRNLIFGRRQGAPGITMP